MQWSERGGAPPAALLVAGGRKPAWSLVRATQELILALLINASIALIPTARARNPLSVNEHCMCGHPTVMME